ncbi:4Fe-4S dicluster domain-containing protein [Desulfocurvibacter africanus]|uniref:4Fe-4S ferredoxin iron-sulfur binding domain-containing protein n=1 Tax=Desulfocurvibacter africanus subsp. africanus str. Walvis Bay TaxID=690850 RepID=F3Z160_DESAF|nr:4Fe-4S dicluster domain-containing protein [Desulfocurvibacter africanus]EGJ49958.1 4Fe-4S ferredoxin iron-sulfur binding domain-containing protein [Desulfocurvibacter africanus subsp. africanus str. Walvis Bay]
MSVVYDIAKKVASMWSLIVGLRVTTKNFFQPQVTVHYPRQSVDNLSTFRGHIELVGQPKDPATPRCITCMLCATVCPSQCISITKAKAPPPEPAKKLPDHAEGPLVPPEKAEPPKAKVIKTPGSFELNFNTCSLCGMCVQNCPVSSLRFSTDVYAAGFSRQEFEYDLMARLRLQAAVLGVAASQVNSPACEDTLERVDPDKYRLAKGPLTQADAVTKGKRGQAA